MAFIPVPLCSLVELLFDWNGQRCEQTLWVATDTAPSAIYLANLAGVVATWWQTDLADSISDSAALVEVVATYKGSQSGPQASVTAGLPDTGNVPTASVPNGTAFVVKFGTANIGRSFRGRNYVVGVPQSAFVDSVMTISAANAILGSYSNLTANLSAIQATHVVVSQFTNGAPRVSGINTPVNSYTATTRASRSQRRRNPGIGT